SMRCVTPLRACWLTDRGTAPVGCWGCPPCRRSCKTCTKHFSPTCLALLWVCNTMGEGKSSGGETRWPLPHFPTSMSERARPETKLSQDLRSNRTESWDRGAEPCRCGG